MQEILIQSKISTPRLHDKIVHRDRLTSLLHENINKSLIIICAPAGYGKTTLILDYLSYYNITHAWLSIPQRGIEDVPTFFEYLIDAFKKLDKRFGASTLEEIKKRSKNPNMPNGIISALSTSFINEFTRYFKKDVILTIDDLHFLDTTHSNSWFNKMFKEEFNEIPPNLHILVSTRVMPQLNLVPVLAKRNVIIIDETELSFKNDETALLIKEIYKFDFEENDILLLDDILKGWITGLHLLLQAYGEDFKRIKYTGEIDLDIIFDFFAQEIFDSLSPELQEFMMATSLLESFDEDLANSAMGINNSGQLINELIQRNVFVHQFHVIRNGSKLTSYHYHALFKDFLNKRLRGSKVSEEITNLLAKIGESYVNSGDEITAMNYFLEAKRFDKAVTLINNNFNELYGSGKYDKLWSWINSIPEKIVNGNAELLYKIGYLFLYTRTDYERSFHYINKAIELFKADNDEDGLMKSSFVKTHILKFKGRTEQAISGLQELLKSCCKPYNIVRIYEHLSQLFSLSNKFKEAEVSLGKALKYCDENKLGKEVRSKLNYAFGILYYNTYEYEKALIYFKMCLENQNSSFIYNRILAICNIAVTYNDMGEYSNSIKYFDIAFEMLEKSQSGELIVHLTGQKALLLQNLGDYRESIKMLETVYPQALMSNSVFYLWQFTDYLFMNYYFLGDKVNSLKYLNLNESHANALGDAQYKKMSQAKKALYSMKYAPDMSAEGMLLDSYDYFESIGGANKKSILFWLANYYLLVNKPELASKYLRKLLPDSNLGANDLIDSRNLIDFALSCQDVVNYKDKIHNAFTEFFDRLNIEGTSIEYREKMKIETDELYDIKMSSFGHLEFVSRGVPVPESGWRKKKGKSILAYMMLKPGAKYSKDKIIEMFFPDAPAKTVEDSFKQAIFNIRSTFKNPHLNFLILEGKTLYFNPDCYLKSDAEEFENLCHIARSSADNNGNKIKACRNAIELYKGEFIDGNYEPWCEDIRVDFHNEFVSISELLIRLLTESENNDEIIFYSEKLLKHDKFNEIAYESLVGAYVRTQRTKLARESYMKMLKAFEAELAELPDSKVLTRISNMLEI